MAKLFINTDGANHQAQAVLAYLRAGDGIEQSWNATRGCYEAEPQVDRWHNCREEGYVVTLKSKDYKHQLNIAFFEHRNSDSICAVEWEQTTLNPPTIDQMPKSVPFYNDKYATSKSVKYGEAAAMASWIRERMQIFWVKNTPKLKAVR